MALHSDFTRGGIPRTKTFLEQPGGGQPGGYLGPEVGNTAVIEEGSYGEGEGKVVTTGPTTSSQPDVPLRTSPVTLRLANLYQVDMQGLQYKSVNFEYVWPSHSMVAVFLIEIRLVMMKRHLVQRGQKDGPIEYVSQLLAQMRFLTRKSTPEGPISGAWVPCGCSQVMDSPQREVIDVKTSLTTPRGTSFMRNTPLLGPYSKTIPRVLWCS